MPSSIVVFGSAVVDLVLNPERLPKPGLTVLAPGYQLLPGGKGSNQAYAASRVGCKDVEFIGAVGDDDFAKTLLGSLAGVGVGVSGVKTRQDAPTACAAVVVDAKGENQICVGSGANLTVTAAQLDDGSHGGRLKAGDILLQQMEIPHDQVWAAVERARGVGAHAVLNVAPAAKVPDAVLGSLDFLIVNEHEALEVFTAAGLGDAESDPLDASIAIAKAYDVAVVVTLGSEGAAACLPHRPPGFAARSDGGCDVLTAAAAPLAEDEQILDTVGAGDAFVGAFCAALAENAPLSACMARASAAGTIACTAVGAQAGVPDAEKMLARAEAVEATGNWGPGDPPSESLLNAEGLSWGRVKV